jgi:hypothetical protein
MPELAPPERTPVPATLGKPSAIPTPICMPTMTGTFTKRAQVRDGKCTLTRDGRHSRTRACARFWTSGNSAEGWASNAGQFSFDGFHR